MVGYVISRVKQQQQKANKRRDEIGCWLKFWWFHIFGMMRLAKQVDLDLNLSSPPRVDPSIYAYLSGRIKAVRDDDNGDDIDGKAVDTHTFHC